MALSSLPAMRIRTASPLDRAGIDALLGRSYPLLMAPAYSPGILAAALPLMTRANPELLASGTFYVAEDERGGLVGCGGWTLETPGSHTIVPGVGHIRHFAVDPTAVRRGVGRALARHCEALAAAAGCSCLEVFSSLNAEQFYASVGFVRLDIIETRIGGVTLPTVHMTKRL